MNKITMSILAIAAITALSFTTAKKVFKENTYNLDSKSTSAIWVGKKVTGEHTGTINISKGMIMGNGKTITGGNFEFDMNSITCTDLTDPAYNAKLITHLKSEDFFSVEKNPSVKFVLNKATLKSENDYEVKGNLTIKGITHEISFPAKIKMDEKKIVTIAKIMVDRTKYDIKYGSANFFKSIGDKAINDEFELNINLVANKN
ncbi:MAG: YceI family protein [Bacteroidia bacterium]